MFSSFGDFLPPLLTPTIARLGTVMPTNLKASIKHLLFILTVSFAALTASLETQAETIFLRCPGVGLSQPGPFTVDLTNRTVNNEPAQINQTSIDWQHPIGSASPEIRSGAIHSHIDRSTGTISQYVIYYMSSGQNQQSGNTTVSCSVGVAPSPKF